MGLAEDMKTIKDAELDIELLYRDNDKKCAENNKEIDGLKERITSTEFIMEEELKKSKEDKVECKFDGYKGSMGWQKMPDKWIYKDEVLMKFILSLPANFKELFLKTTITIRKVDIKKKMILDNSTYFLQSKLTDKLGKLFIVDGKKDYLVKGIEIEPQDPKFKYSIKKIK